MSVPSPYALHQYKLRKPISTTAIPHADIVYSPKTQMLAVAANHLEGLSIFNYRATNPLYDGEEIKHLSYCVDLCPTENAFVAGSTGCTLEMLSFSLA